MNVFKQLNKILNKVGRISNEIKSALMATMFINPSVTIFGSARTTRDDVYYHKAMLLGRKLADAGFDVITGGGPGIMEAANKGAYTSPLGKSIGFSINLGTEHTHNAFLDKHKKFQFFFTRKYMMMSPAFAYVAFPGGVGTLDEFFEIITLIQTGKSKPAKVYLIGVAFYTPLLAYMTNIMLPAGVISESDLELFEITDNVSDVTHSILDAYKELHV